MIFRGIEGVQSTVCKQFSLEINNNFVTKICQAMLTFISLPSCDMSLIFSGYKISGMGRKVIVFPFGGPNL
jgi:hypothetical protein